MSSFGPPPDFARDFRAHLALTAKRNKQWIFSKTTKNWYTPEEFGFAKKALEYYLYPTANSLFINGCFHQFNNTPFIQPFKLHKLFSAKGYSLRHIEKNSVSILALQQKAHLILKELGKWWMS